MDEIVKIVLNRNKSRKLLSYADAKRISEIIKGINNYYDFSIDFSNKDFKNDLVIAGECYSDSVTFYKNGIQKLLDIFYKEFNKNKSFDGSKIDIYNFFYLSIIFHEFSHVRQHRIVDFGYSSLERTLFKICYKLMNVDSFYDDNYKNFPIEIDAFNRGFIGAYKIYSCFPKDFLTDNDKNAFANYMLDTLFANYSIDANKEIIISPVETFYKSADKYNVSKVGVNINKLKEILENKNDMTIYRKLILGLPVSFYEYAYANMINDIVHTGKNIDFVKRLQKKM